LPVPPAEHLGEISAHKRRLAIYTTGSILKRGRHLGLTRQGGPMHDLADDFALIRGDLPARPERSETGKDLPPEVMRQLCAHLDWLDGRAGRETRVAIEVLIDTGRRPDEACELGYDCLIYDNDGKPVLVYCDSKENRPQRQLPLHQATADLIRGQQARVRSRYPGTPVAELKLLPSVIRNPHGRKAISAVSLGETNWIWVDAMPEIRLDDGTVFDKSKVFPYAYRHTYVICTAISARGTTKSGVVRFVPHKYLTLHEARAAGPGPGLSSSLRFSAVRASRDSPASSVSDQAILKIKYR
jgi:integrase